MQKEFIPYEQALELKELGFDKKCMFSYHRNNTEYIDSAYVELANYNANEKLVSAVLYQQAFRWFREKYGLVHSIGDQDLYLEKGENIHIGIGVNSFVYQEAELSCLKKLIEIAKNK